MQVGVFKTQLALPTCQKWTFVNQLLIIVTASFSEETNPSVDNGEETTATTRRMVDLISQFAKNKPGLRPATSEQLLSAW